MPTVVNTVSQLETSISPLNFNENTVSAIFTRNSAVWDNETKGRFFASNIATITKACYVASYSYEDTDGPVVGQGRTTPNLFTLNGNAIELSDSLNEGYIIVNGYILKLKANKKSEPCRAVIPGTFNDGWIVCVIGEENNDLTFVKFYAISTSQQLLTFKEFVANTSNISAVTVARFKSGQYILDPVSITIDGAPEGRI